MSCRNSLIIALSIIIVLNLCMQESSWGQIWSTPIPVTDDSASCILDDLEVDPTGKAWILYHNTSKYPHDFVFIKYYDGVNWSPPIRTPVDGHFEGDLAIDYQGRIWLTWKINRDLLCSIYASYYTNANWMHPDTVITDSAILSRPKTTVDNPGSMWIAWSRVFGPLLDTCAICVSKQIDDEWSDATVVDQFIVPDVTIDPAIVCDGHGRMWCAWSNGIPVASYYNGSEWSEPITIGESIDNFFLDAAVDGKGKVWILWGDLYGTDPNKEYGYKIDYNVGIEWSTPILIPESRELHDISFAADPVGRIWVIYSKNNSIFCKYFHDGTWSSAMPITNDPLFNDINPMVISNNKNNLWVAWNRASNDIYNIYASCADINLVAVKSHRLSSPIPERFRIIQNYPNPINKGTIVTYTVPEKQFISLRIYNITGRLVVTLGNAEHQPGKFSVYWDGNDYGGLPLVSGIYFCRLETENFSQSIKLVLLR